MRPAAVIEVVIPAHNAAPFLRETLESVAAQTRPPALVTVVDDRSTDGTAELAEAAGRDLGLPLRVLPSEGPPGPSGARNTALRRGGGPPLVALLDADDLHLPHHHAALAALLEGAPAASLAFGDCALFESATGKVLLASHHADAGLPPAGAIGGEGGETVAGHGAGAAFALLLRAGVFGTSACLFRREAAMRAGLFDEASMYGEDTDLFLRVALLGGPFARTERHVSRKRVHGRNLTRPENRLRFVRATAETVARLAARAASGEIAPPAPEGPAALAERLPRALDAYLYEASLHGLARYREAAALARRAGHGGLALRPRHLARLGARLVFGARAA